MCVAFFFNDTATTEIYTLSLHDALPISIALDDRRQLQLDRFHGAETLAAGFALTPTANRRAVFRDARVDDPGIGMLAEGAMHGTPGSGGNLDATVMAASQRYLRRRSAANAVCAEVPAQRAQRARGGRLSPPCRHQGADRPQRSHARCPAITSNGGPSPKKASVVISPCLKVKYSVAATTPSAAKVPS